MKTPAKALLAFLTLTFAFLATGCTATNRNDSSIPWGRPQGWERQVPGMGEVGDTSGVR